MSIELNIWLFTDEKPGHKNQLLGLLSSLKKISSVQQHWIKADNWFVGLAIKNQTKPNLILCCGHKTHLAALLCAKKYSSPICVLMNPSLPLFLFDYGIIPNHDNPPNKNNIHATLGALNAIEPSENLSNKKGTILIGGSSSHYEWDNSIVWDQITDLIESNTSIKWCLGTSRRTPTNFLNTSSINEHANLDVMPFDDAPSDWLNNQLSQSENVWVTEDSVSMLYEALSCGAKVGLVKLKRKGNSLKNRIHKQVDNLQEHGYLVSTISDEKNQKAALQESDKAAKWLVNQLA